jgi:hypothetical protein
MIKLDNSNPPTQFPSSFAWADSIKASFWDLCTKIYNLFCSKLPVTISESEIKNAPELINRIELMLSKSNNKYETKSEELQDQINSYKNKLRNFRINCNAQKLEADTTECQEEFSKALCDQFTEKFNELSEEKKEQAIRRFVFSLKWHLRIGNKIPIIKIDENSLKTFWNINLYKQNVSNLFLIMFMDAIESTETAGSGKATPKFNQLHQ